MKKCLLSPVLLVSSILILSGFCWAQCPEDPYDLGICDTIYFETFDCDHFYQAEPGSFDSVRVAVYVTHDSNTFLAYPGEPEERWVQDSLGAMVISPLKFWHEPPGCADSVILPYHPSGWNNQKMDLDDPAMNRSMFRHIVDTHTGDTTYNRLLQMVEAGKPQWTPFKDFESFSCDGDSGRCGFSVVPMSENCQKWWEGSRVLLATLTFHVYMSEFCDTTEIGLDHCWEPVGGPVRFTRYDATTYVPRDFLPVKETIYIPICGDCNDDGLVDIGDVSYIINYLFVGGPAPRPMEAGDANCDQVVDIADASYLLNYLFTGGPPPEYP